MGMQNVILKRPLRVFKQIGTGSALYKTGEVIPVGATIQVGQKPQSMVFDHRYQNALVIIWQGAKDSSNRFVLDEEYNRAMS